MIFRSFRVRPSLCLYACLLAAAFALSGAGWTLNGQINTFNGRWSVESEGYYGATFRVYDARPDYPSSTHRIRGPFFDRIGAVGAAYLREYWEVDEIVIPAPPPTVYTDDRWGAEPKAWSRGVVADSNTDVQVVPNNVFGEVQTIRLPLAPFAATARSLSVFNAGSMSVSLSGGVLNLTPLAANEALRVGIAGIQNVSRETYLNLYNVTLTSASIAMIGVGLPVGSGGSLVGEMSLSNSSQWFHPAGLIEIGGGGGKGQLLVDTRSVLAGSSQPGAQPDPRAVVRTGSRFRVGQFAQVRLSELSVNSFMPLSGVGDGWDSGLYVDSGSLQTARLLLGETATAKARFYTWPSPEYAAQASSLGVVTVERNSRLELEHATVNAASVDVMEGSVNVDVGAIFTIGDPNSPGGAVRLLQMARTTGSVSGLSVKGPIAGPSPGALFTVHGSALLGGYGTATVEVVLGGALDIRGRAFLGQSESSWGGAAGNGSVTVEGAGSLFRAQNLEVGFSYFDSYVFNLYASPTGLLKISAGGRTEVTGTLTTGWSATRDANGNFIQGEAHEAGEMSIGKKGTLDLLSGGKLVFADPTNGTAVRYYGTQQLTNYGRIQGGDDTGGAPPTGGQIDFGAIGGNLTNYGTIAPGHSAGWLTINGKLTLESTSTLLLELGGTTRGSGYDALTVTGALSAGGTLTVSLINGYSPISGASFDLLDFGSISGTFTTVTLPVGYAWNTDALYTTGVISLGAVPEPSTYALGAGLGALGVAVVRRRLRRPRCFPLRRCVGPVVRSI